MLSSSVKQQFNSNGIFYTSEQIASILKSCSVRVGGEIDTHYLIYCPFHYNVNTPAAEIDKQKGMFLCFSCGENGSITDMVMRTTGRNYFEATRLIKSKEQSCDISNVIQSALDFDPESLKEFDKSLIDRLHESLMNNNRALDYYESRGINKISCVDFKLGYSEKQDMVVVPVHDPYGMCVGFVARGIDQKVFKNSVGLPKKQILFNLHRVRYKTIAVVESSFDAIRMSQLSIPAVATLGAWPSKRQLELLSKYAESIIICPDKDDAGKKMVDKIKDNLHNKNIGIMDVGTNAKDVGDLTNNEIISRYINVDNLNIVGL